MGKLQFMAAFDRERGAKFAAGVCDHEIHIFRRYFLRCHNEVTLVLTVLIIDHDDELAVAEVFNSFLYGVKLDLAHCWLCCVIVLFLSFRSGCR